MNTAPARNQCGMLYIHIILTFRKRGASIKTSLSGPSFNLWALRGR